MNKFLVGLMLVLVSSSANAEWTAVGGSESFTVYANQESLRKDGNKVKMWDMTDNKIVQKSPSGNLLSRKTLTEYDCVGEQTRTLAYSWFSGNMGEGDVLTSENFVSSWSPVQPDSTSNLVKEVRQYLKQQKKLLNQV